MGGFWGRVDETLFNEFLGGHGLAARLIYERQRGCPFGVITDYFQAMGWDKESGWPGAEKLEALGLSHSFWPYPAPQWGKGFPA